MTLFPFGATLFETSIAGTYFVVISPLCVHFPKPTDRYRPLNLMTLGEKLPPDIYLEVKGQLRDVFPIYGIGIQTSLFRDIDAEVKTSIDEAKQPCERWQDANSAALSKRAHGAAVVRNPQNLRGNDYTHDCAIWAVDNELPHEEFIVRRPHP